MFKQNYAVHYRPADNKNKSHWQHCEHVQHHKVFYVGQAGPFCSLSPPQQSTSEVPYLSYGHTIGKFQKKFTFIFGERFLILMPSKTVCVNKQWQVAKADGFEKICGSPWLGHPSSSAGYWQRKQLHTSSSLTSLKKASSSQPRWLPQGQDRTSTARSLTFFIPPPNRACLAAEAQLIIGHRHRLTGRVITQQEPQNRSSLCWSRPGTERAELLLPALWLLTTGHDHFVSGRCFWAHYFWPHQRTVSKSEHHWTLQCWSQAQPPASQYRPLLTALALVSEGLGEEWDISDASSLHSQTNFH